MNNDKHLDTTPFDPKELELPRSTERSTTHEVAPKDLPRIYVASLSDYNNGHLHGTWLAATDSPEDLQAAISAMLAKSRQPDAEEFAIHDFDGFGDLQLSEYESLERVSRLAQGIAEYGHAFAAWADLHIDDDSQWDRFEEAYFGYYDSLDDYAEQLADDLGYTKLLSDTIPEYLKPYTSFDSEQFGRDIHDSGDISISDASHGGIWIFDGRM